MMPESTPEFVLTLFVSFGVGLLVAVIGLYHLLVTPLQRSMNALEEKVDKLKPNDQARDSAPTSSERKSWTDSDPHRRRTLLPRDPNDVPLVLGARDTLPSPQPIG